MTIDVAFEYTNNDVFDIDKFIIISSAVYCVFSILYLTK
jgi:hypothetical protein